ncbi:MAG: Hsp20/alpha crystallin family protein [Myxococcales bacterium]|nr:Hsp20/alpha crystallin family protein [Myxococcales bacterium]
MTTISRWDPFAEMNRLHDQLFSRVAREDAFRPAVDIHEDDEAFSVDVEVPGMSPDDIRVDVEKNLLTVSGERRLSREEQKDGYRRVERSYGSFTRSFTLPDTVDAESIEASTANGVLTLRLPKKPAPGARRIDVKSS